MEHAMNQPETCEISQTADRGKVDELAMLVRQLVHSLRKLAPDNDLTDRALDYLKRNGLAGTFLRGNSTFVPENVPAQLKPSKASEVVGTSGSASASKNVPALTEQDAVLLEQAASMLEGLESDERNRGNCTTAEGARCSAHAVRRLASTLLAHEREIGQCLHQIQEPEADIWPCVNIDVDASGKITNAKLYSPGLPAGNHDVYPVRVPYMDEHTEAWLACVAELRKHLPEFMHLRDMNGIECAVAAIRELVERSAPVQASDRDAAFEAVRQKFCKLQRYSFFLDDKGNVRRTPDYCGNWVEFEAVHTLFEPAAVEAAIAARAAQGSEHAN